MEKSVASQALDRILSGCIERGNERRNPAKGDPGSRCADRREPSGAGHYPRRSFCLGPFRQTELPTAAVPIPQAAGAPSSPVQNSLMPCFEFAVQLRRGTGDRPGTGAQIKNIKTP